jgi:hypothetical protein
MMIVDAKLIWEQFIKCLGIYHMYHFSFKLDIYNLLAAVNFVLDLVRSFYLVSRQIK